jgi:hypothetical protein
MLCGLGFEHGSSLNKLVNLWFCGMYPFTCGTCVARCFLKYLLSFLVLSLGYSPVGLKVHKIENFFGFDFEICTFS